MRRALFHNIDLVFRPLDKCDNGYRREPISIKKLLKGDCSWDYIKVILGWEINTKLMTIHLPPHRVHRLLEILALFPASQKRTTLKVWQRFLGELRSMAIALPGARGLFSHMQHALTDRQSPHRITLTAKTHDAIADFKMLARGVVERPTRIAELIPLRPSVAGAHDASGLGAGGVIFAANHVARRPTPTTLSCIRTPIIPPTPLPSRYTPWKALLGANRSAPNADPALSPQSQHHPIVYRMLFPPEIRSTLVSSTNPNGDINNSDLELAGSFVHHAAVVENYDVRERTVASFADNTPTIYWQRKGSVTSTSAPARILRLQALHQRRFGYVPRHDFLAGIDNKLADDASRLTHLSDTLFLKYFNDHYPQPLPWRLWTPPLELQRCVISALLNSRSRAEYAPALTLPLPITGSDGDLSASVWPSTPYSPILKTPSRYSKSSLFDTGQAKTLPLGNLSVPAPWKVPYGQLSSRLPVWGATTLA